MGRKTPTRIEETTTACRAERATKPTSAVSHTATGWDQNLILLCHQLGKAFAFFTPKFLFLEREAVLLCSKPPTVR